MELLLGRIELWTIRELTRRENNDDLDAILIEAMKL